ncbi:hypothetical protein [Macrococcus carouselicus]|nr:hypothetical protein [Macrococcus carouselicus]
MTKHNFYNGDGLFKEFSTKGKIMKKSKKRKQNMNVARVVKLDDYRA